MNSPNRLQQIESLFHAALELHPAERAAFLAEACANDPALLDAVNALLVAHDQSFSLLDHHRAEAEADSASAATKHLPDAPAQQPAPGLAPHPSGGGQREGRFVTGAMLAGRYRIVSLLGRGGMGEVYKADDLKLNQTVALKFLPESIALEAKALARFHNEVRTARQVAHPNVCRVYDIGEVEGLHFISMEFIDGEDLSSLLRRIGRLPGDKAIEIARQMCAGLAAAHEAGVLHRDLKPANVMIDGRGKARITDFGLAVVTEEMRGDEAMAGTPAYMSPEQLTGKEVTQRSDIYSLGLVLYELFTGKRVFEAQSIHELIALHEKSEPATPSSHVKDIDPLAERVILRCLEKEPKKRPASAVQVALALPGGDPLQAALAMGETPSPEMVAAAGEKTGLRPKVALACLAAIIVGLFLSVWLGSKVNLIERVPLDTPDALARKAREIVAQLGYADRPADSVWEFAYNYDYLRHVEKNDPSPARWHHIQPQAVVFKYRESQQYFQPSSEFLIPSNFSLISQSPTLPGMVDVILDPQGRLLSFITPPTPADQSVAAAPDWAMLFRLAGLDPLRFAAEEPVWTPPVAFDSRAAWTGSAADQPDAPLRIETAAWRGKPVYFKIAYPWTPQPQSEFSQSRLNWRWGGGQFALIFLIVAMLVARSNQRRGRGDRQGAFRLFCLVFALSLLITVFTMHYVPEPLQLLNNLRLQLPLWLTFATLASLSYFAFEPYVRRYWPHSIISWSRALAGRWRDALVGRDVLIGTLGGICLYLVRSLTGYLLGYSKELAPRANDISILISLPGMRAAGGAFFLVLLNAFAASLLLFTMLFLLRGLLRRQWLAASIATLLTLLALPQTGYQPAVSVPLMALYSTTLVMLALRYGLVAYTVAVISLYLLLSFPLTVNFSAWYLGSEMVALLAVLALAVYGFYTSLGGQKVFQGSLLED